MGVPTTLHWDRSRNASLVSEKEELDYIPGAPAHPFYRVAPCINECKTWTPNTLTCRDPQYRYQELHPQMRFCNSRDGGTADFERPSDFDVAEVVRIFRL